MATYKRGSGNYKSSYFKTAVKTADVTLTNDSTVNDDDELKVSLKANTRYSGWVQLAFKAHGTPDLKVTFKAISGSVYAFYMIGSLATAVTRTNFGTELTINCDNSFQFIIIPFNFLTGSSLQQVVFQWAQATSDANNTIVYQGSTMFVYEE